MSVSWQSQQGYFGQLVLRVNTALDVALGKIAFDVKAEAQDNAPKDTGALAASIYIVSQKTDGYASMVSDVEEANPKLEEKGEIWPDDLQPDQPLLWLVVVGVMYGWWVHEGTEHQAAQPFLEQAMESVGARAEAAFATELGKL